MLFAATNEVPEHAELGALKDRFGLKAACRSVQETHFVELLDAGLEAQTHRDLNRSRGPRGTPSLDDLLKAHRYLTLHDGAGRSRRTATLFFRDEVMREFRRVVRTLVREDEVFVSDRKLIKLYRLLRTRAWIMHGGAVEREDLQLLSYLGETPRGDRPARGEGAPAARADGVSRLTSAEAEAFLAAACTLARPHALAPERAEVGWAALQSALAELPSLATPTLPLDLACLLSGERLESNVQVPPALRDAFRAYEDNVLARMLGDRRWTALCEAVAAAPKELRGIAVGLLVSQLLTRLQVPAGVGISQAAARRLSQRSADELLASGRLVVGERPELTALIGKGFEDLARAARRAKELITDAEVFLLENVAALKGLGPRVALAQLALVAAALEDRLPVRMKSSASEGETPTQLEEESAYPVGGFSSISTVGTLENLVSSELIYMDELGAERPDLFDLRFVEGELLYYARDESVAVRRRRTVVLVFDASLDACRVLDPQEKYQRLLFALGAGAAMVRRLASWLDSEAVQFDLVFTGAVQGRESPLREEMNVMGLLLREWRERGQLELREAVDVREALQTAHERHRVRLQTIVFAGEPSGALPVPPGSKPAPGEAGPPDGLVIATPEGPASSWKGARLPPVKARATEAWAQVSRELLEALLSARSTLRRQDVADSLSPRVP